MPRFIHPSVLDGGTDVLRSRAATAGRLQYHELRAFAVGDAWATLLANSLGNVALAAADFAQTDGSANARVCTVAGKNIAITTASGASPALHAAVLDTVAQVALVVNIDGSSGSPNTPSTDVLNVGATRQLPSYTITLGQPA